MPTEEQVRDAVSLLRLDRTDEDVARLTGIGLEAVIGLRGMLASAPAVEPGRRSGDRPLERRRLTAQATRGSGDTRLRRRESEATRV